jgi:hypothetical protein
VANEVLCLAYGIWCYRLNDAYPRDTAARADTGKCAEAFLGQYGSDSDRLSGLYDDDEMLRSALATLFSNFEYPDFSHLTMREVRQRYAAAPLKLPM